MLEVNWMVLEGAEPRMAGTADSASELIGRVVIEEGAKVSGSRIVGPAIIGAGPVVTGSYIGPVTSVAAGGPPDRSIPDRPRCRGDARALGS